MQKKVYEFEDGIEIFVKVNDQHLDKYMNARANFIGIIIQKLFSHSKLISEYRKEKERNKLNDEY